VLDVLPVFVRAGSIVPMQPLIQSTDETPSGPLELRVYPGPECTGSIYLDDGHTFAYKHGDFLRQAFTCSSDGAATTVKLGAREGSYAPWWKTVELVIYDWPAAQADAMVSGGAALKTTYDASARALHVMVPESAGGAEVVVRR
jgi:alpha-glucosidase